MDFAMYKFLPKSVATAASAGNTFFFFLILHTFGFSLYTIVAYVAALFGLEKLSQPYILHEASRQSFGFAFGTISSIMWGFYMFVSPHVVRAWSVLVALLVLTIVCALVITSTTKPKALPKDADRYTHPTRCISRLT
jgi:phage shock protein PspC (stress-responsive transcriptional regulator)